MARYRYTVEPDRIEPRKVRPETRTFADGLDACLFGETLLPHRIGAKVRVDRLDEEGPSPVGAWTWAGEDAPKWRPV